MRTTHLSCVDTIYAALNIPYEVVALKCIAHLLDGQVPVVAVVVIVMVIYGSLNVLTVRYFGVSEFYSSFFKIFLMVDLSLYTFVTMVGGNPDNDAINFGTGRTLECLSPI